MSRPYGAVIKESSFWVTLFRPYGTSKKQRIFKRAFITSTPFNFIVARKTIPLHTNHFTVNFLTTIINNASLKSIFF
jgi:hypothetical protein